MKTLDQIISDKQDRLRGRPRDWRDELSYRWRRFDVVDDVVWRIFTLLVFAYAILALIGLICVAMLMLQ